MNNFALFSVQHRIKKRGPLRSCLILMAAVTIPVIIALIFSQSMIDGISNIYICLSDGHLTTSDEVPQDSIIYSVDSTVSGYVMLYSKTDVAGLRLKGVENSYFNPRRAELVEFSEKVAPSNLKQVLVSKATADKLAVKPGDKIALMLVSSANQKTTRPVLAVVGGTFQTGYEQLDTTIAFTDLTTAESWFSTQPETHEILLNKEFGTNSRTAASELGLEHWDGWETKNPAIYENLKTSSQMILTILILVSVMAAFYTAMASNQMISEDMRNLAILRLLGMDRKAVVRNSVVSVMFVTLVGILTGLVIGLIAGYCLNPLLTLISKTGFSALSNYLLNFKIILPWKNMALICLLMLLLSWISVLLSLQKTRNISPMQLFIEL